MKFFTTKQAAERLGVCAKTVERWRRSGKFVPALTTAGGRSRYSLEQIELALQGIYSGNPEVAELLS